MSTGKKLAAGAAVTELVEAVQLLTDEEAYDLHAIEIYQDGSVYDAIEQIEYNSLTEWAEAQVAESEPKFQKRRSHKYDEE
jgi:hypothetical protein